MISIFVPVFNEQHIILDTAEKILDYTKKLEIPFEIIFVDNGSTDSTKAILEQYQHSQSSGFLKILHLPGRGVGAAFKAAVQGAKFDKIVCLDADLSSGLEFISLANSKLQTLDILVGSKLKGSQQRRFVRKFSSLVFVKLCQFLTGIQSSDFSIGYKAYKKSLVLPLLDELDSHSGYTLELQAYAAGANLLVEQTPLNCVDFRTSRFNLFAEGIYRYIHLFKTTYRMNCKNS